jgi:hypothetical protein
MISIVPTDDPAHYTLESVRKRGGTHSDDDEIATLIPTEAAITLGAQPIRIMTRFAVDTLKDVLVGNTVIPVAAAQDRFKRFDPAKHPTDSISFAVTVEESFVSVTCSVRRTDGQLTCLTFPLIHPPKNLYLRSANITDVDGEDCLAISLAPRNELRWWQVCTRRRVYGYPALSRHG